jgi:outer membrane lipoprotein SlyB
VAVGALTGGAVGALAGAATAGLVPGLAPVIGASLLAAISGGATAGGLVGALIGLGISEEEAREHEGAIHAGRTVVVVQPGDRFGDAIDILRRLGTRSRGRMSR